MTTAEEPAPPTDATASRRAEMASRDAAFETELRAYVQRRLTLVIVFLGMASGALYVVGRIADAASRGLSLETQLHPSPLTHLLATLLAIPIYRYLKSGRRSAAELLAVDALILSLLIGASLAIYALSYAKGSRQVVPLLALLLVARAIVIPSRPRRTFLLCLPAPLGILAIQLLHGEVFTFDGERFPQAGFTAYVLWDQATLYTGVALAALASRIVYGLRVRAFEAARMGRYTLEARIGGGAIGEVFRAHHALIRRPVAVKILRPEVAGERNLERFEREVQRTSRLTHPNTVHVFDYGLTAEGLFYYAMEHLDGADLERILAVDGAMPPSRVIHVLRQACGALEEAHGQGLIHCDLKPANLMLCRQGGQPDVVKVLDFGLARNVKQREDFDERGSVSGTPLTMSPEMILGEDVGPAADLYALGAVGYYLATGEPPFTGATAGEVLGQHLNAEPTPPSARAPAVPPDLEQCLLQCLAKDTTGRPPSAECLRRMLDRCADAGRWTTPDAERWWRGHGPALGA